jgi:exonuclease III
MIITTWNCNLKLQKKYEHIESLNSDITIIQECEKLKQDYFPDVQYFWTGIDEKKGLGVIVKKDSAQVSSLHNKNLIHFLPIIADEINILGVWAFNHRAKKYGEHVDGKTLEAIKYYYDWLQETPKSIVAGDFNNSIIWDKLSNKDFYNINEKLELIGLSSSYHKVTSDDYGEEKQGTFYHTKNIQKQYHIDYIYTCGMDVKSVNIGVYEDWVQYSDHCPITVEV